MHTISVLAVTPDLQCESKSFTVMPIQCTQQAISLAKWTDSGTKQLALDYTITDVTTQTFEYTNDFLSCQVDRLIE